MKKRALESWKERKFFKSPQGAEFYNYPSATARKYWFYVLSLGRARVSRGFLHKPVRQEGFLLHYIRRGQMSHRLRDQTYHVSKGKVCLMDFSESIECWHDDSKPAHNWWVLFNGRDMPALFAELRADRDPVFDSLDTIRLDSYFRELLALTQWRPDGYEARSSAVLHGILAELFASRVRRGELASLIGSKTVLSEAVRKGIDYMTRFYSNDALGLKAICVAAGLSLHYFGRVFHREVGISPIQYLNRYRVEQAKRLLVHGNKTMEQISGLVGASNQNYFSYLFRRLTGMTPREYKAKALRPPKHQG